MEGRIEEPARRSQPAILQESAHSMLLSVAVFAGRSGRTNRFGLFLVHHWPRSCFSLRVGITVYYELQISDVYSVRLQARRPVGTKPIIEIQHLRTCDGDCAKRPIETQNPFIAKIPAGAETKEREPPPISLRPETKDRIRLLLPRLRCSRELLL